MSVCLVVVKSFHLKTVLPHVKPYFHTARQNAHANKLFRRNPVTAKSTTDVSQAEREAPTTSQTDVNTLAQESLSQNACTTGGDQVSSSHSLR